MNKHEEMSRKNARLGLTILGVVLVMAGLAYASAPLYKLFCAATGFGGTTQVSGTLPDHVSERGVTVRFNADTDPHLPWDFHPEQSEIKLKLGQKGVVAFIARNKADEAITGTALYNVTPLKAGKYFHKIQCFCFGEQTLGPHQEVSMPVMFFVDPEMQDDPNMQDVKTITLSYTFFKAQTKALDKALEDFYNE